MKRILFFLCGLLFGLGAPAQEVVRTAPAPVVRPDTLFETEPADLPADREADWRFSSQITFTDADGVVHVKTTYEPRNTKGPANLFREGGTGWMSVLTLLLVALVLAAVKMPDRVREIGALALCVGTLSLLVGLYGISDVLRNVGDVPSTVVYGGLRVALIAPLYGLGIWILSLVIRLARQIFNS